MKKILVVLLVLAVAGGVFAQEGTWSVSGTVEIGTYIDFDNDAAKHDDGTYNNKEPAVVRSSGYNAPYGYYQPLDGYVSINYSLGGLGAGLTFSTLDYDLAAILGAVTYDGENFKFQIESDLGKLIAGDYTGYPRNVWDDGAGGMSDVYTGSINSGKNVKHLWGYYKLLNGLIHLEAAYNSRDINGVFWTSDTAAGFFVDGNYTVSGPITRVSKLTDFARIYKGSTNNGKENDAMDPGGRSTFSGNSHGNYLLANVELENLNFGVLIPRLFWDTNAHGGNTTYAKIFGVQSYADPDDRAYQADAWFPKALHWKPSGDNSSLLVADVLKHMVFGVKFQMQPIEFAAQFLVEDYAVYFGGKVYFGALTVGASFMGVMAPTNAAGDKADETIIRVGGSLDYSADAFGAGLQAWLGVYGDADDKMNQIGVEPYFFYNVIPTHLQFRADVAFYFNNVYEGSTKNNELSEIIWALQPQLFWNFLGTGAGSYYAFNTGMIVRYRMVKEANNALDVSFRFSF